MKHILGIVLSLSFFAGCVKTEPVDRETESRTANKTEKEKEGRTVKEHKSGEWSPGLSEEEKATLFAIARDTMTLCVEGKREKFSFDKYNLTDKLKKNCATFVTFKNQDRLRGCVGCLEAYEPMYKSVQTSAENASNDGRFRDDPIRLDELPAINIHVSLLSPRREIPSVDDFKIGQHGICIRKGSAGAVFLPEVAVEQKWTKEVTLSYLSRKAGLDTDAWRSGTEFKVFESVVLMEE